MCTQLHLSKYRNSYWTTDSGFVFHDRLFAFLTWGCGEQWQWKSSWFRTFREIYSVLKGKDMVALHKSHIRVYCPALNDRCCDRTVPLETAFFKQSLHLFPSLTSVKYSPNFFSQLFLSLRKTKTGICMGAARKIVGQLHQRKFRVEFLWIEKSKDGRSVGFRSANLNNNSGWVDEFPNWLWSSRQSIANCFHNDLKLATLHKRWDAIMWREVIRIYCLKLMQVC